MNLDERLNRMAELFEAKHAVNWSIGDESARMIEEFGKEVVGKIAEMGRCSKAKIMQAVRVSKTFPQELRYPEVNWTIYRAVYNAHMRLKKPAEEILQYVLDNELSVADIESLGKENKKSQLSKKCEWCGTRVSITADEGLVGQGVFCPICITNELSLYDRGDIQHFSLGVLK